MTLAKTKGVVMPIGKSRAGELTIGRTKAANCRCVEDCAVRTATAGDRTVESKGGRIAADNGGPWAAWAAGP